jgi:hypothetical protein
LKNPKRDLIQKKLAMLKPIEASFLQQRTMIKHPTRQKYDAVVIEYEILCSG